MKNKYKYFVWRRSDGYVNATCYMPPNSNCNTFEKLGEFSDWDDALKCIIKNQPGNAK